MEPPKYRLGTLVLSNLPYTHGTHRDRELGMIIHIYQKAIPFTRISVYRYVVEWSGYRVPSTYAEEDIDCFVENLRDAVK